MDRYCRYLDPYYEPRFQCIGESITDGKTVQGNCKTVPDSPVCVMQFIWIFFFFFYESFFLLSFLPSLVKLPTRRRKPLDLN